VNLINYKAFTELLFLQEDTVRKSSIFFFSAKEKISGLFPRNRMNSVKEKTSAS